MLPVINFNFLRIQANCCADDWTYYGYSSLYIYNHVCLPWWKFRNLAFVSYRPILQHIRFYFDQNSLVWVLTILLRIIWINSNTSVTKFVFDDLVDVCSRFFSIRASIRDDCTTSHVCWKNDDVCFAYFGASANWTTSWFKATTYTVDKAVSKRLTTASEIVSDSFFQSSTYYYYLRAVIIFKPLSRA